LDLVKSLSIKPSEIVFLFAGKFIEVKNPFLLIETFINLKKQKLNVRLLFAGNGILENEIIKRLKELPIDISSSITLLPFQDQTQMKLLYRVADVFVLPSRSETWGLSVNEALACGTPVLVSDKCGSSIDLVKDDLNAKEMFKLQKCTSKDRKTIAEYCIQDCVLVIKLLAKLEVITNKMSMANVCHVPFYYLLIRGQGIKSLSLVSKKCRSKHFLIPVLDKNIIDENKDKYEGAIVFEPKLGFYQTYIPVLDYNSLYPSSIISENISHETIVIDPEYDNLPDYIYKDVTYTNPTDEKIVTCRYAKHKDKFGIIPEILQELLSERKATKKFKSFLVIFLLRQPHPTPHS
jgi:DNA polymerase elongation subunit (family B)